MSQVKQSPKRTVRKTQMPTRSFKEKVLNIVKNIPKGSTLTYKEVARRAGSPNAYRAVGSIMSRNFDVDVPCHRVIKSNGSLGNYNRGGQVRKCELLRQENAL